MLECLSSRLSPCILRNEKYRRRDVWNRRKAIWNRLTGRKEVQFRPESEWEVLDNPDLRIVSDELWFEVQHRTDSNGFGGRRRGGLNRSEASRGYVLSGLLGCEWCGGNAVSPVHCYTCRGICDCDSRTVQMAENRPRC